MANESSQKGSKPSQQQGQQNPHQNLASENEGEGWVDRSSHLEEICDKREHHRQQQRHIGHRPRGTLKRQYLSCWTPPVTVAHYCGSPRKERRGRQGLLLEHHWSQPSTLCENLKFNCFSPVQTAHTNITHALPGTEQMRPEQRRLRFQAHVGKAQALIDKVRHKTHHHSSHLPPLNHKTNQPSINQCGRQRPQDLS